MIVQATPAAPPAQPPLEYRLACDLASGLLWRERLPAHGTLVVASSVELVHEALLRLDGAVTVAAESTNIAEMARLARSSRGGEVGQPSVVAADDMTRLPAAGHACALWVGPQPASWRERAQAISRALMPQGTLVVLSAGALSPWLRAFRRVPAADTSVWPGASLTRALARSGLRRERTWRIGTGASILWALAVRTAARAGRPDLVDRAEAAFRQSLGASTGRYPALVEVCSFRVERAP